MCKHVVQGINIAINIPAIQMMENSEAFIGLTAFLASLILSIYISVNKTIQLGSLLVNVH